MTDNSQLDDGQLLAAMLATTGDSAEAAFVALYRRRQSGLYRFALRMTGSHAAAEDAVQETFLVLMRRAANYDAARGSVSAFLYGIARNCVLRGLERAGTLLAVDDEELEDRIEEATAGRGGSNHLTLTAASWQPHPPVHLDETLSRAEQVEALRRAILTLPEHYRAAVVLCDLEEFSYEEAATAMGCAVGTVRSRLHRARAMLGERLLTAEDAEGTEVKAKPARENKAGKATRAMECEA